MGEASCDEDVEGGEERVQEPPFLVREERVRRERRPDRPPQRPQPLFAFSKPEETSQAEGKLRDEEDREPLREVKVPRVGAVEERDALDDVGVQESERRQGRCAVKGRVEGEAEETGDQAAEWGGFRWTSQIVSGLSLF